jgi:hypothetical protein
MSSSMRRFIVVEDLVRIIFKELISVWLQLMCDGDDHTCSELEILYLFLFFFFVFTRRNSLGVDLGT